jgi:hypothetical protein
MMDASYMVVQIVGRGERDAAIATEVKARAGEMNVFNVLLEVALAAAHFATQRALPGTKYYSNLSQDNLSLRTTTQFYQRYLMTDIA